MPQVLLQSIKICPESNDLSVITNNLSNNIQQIADSINGLVEVAKQSQTNQQIDFLHCHRKELEDTIGVFDGACVELELKILDESRNESKNTKRCCQRICKSWMIKKKNCMRTSKSWKR